MNLVQFALPVGAIVVEILKYKHFPYYNLGTSTNFNNKKW